MFSRFWWSALGVDKIRLGTFLVPNDQNCCCCWSRMRNMLMSRRPHRWDIHSESSTFPMHFFLHSCSINIQFLTQLSIMLMSVTQIKRNVEVSQLFVPLIFTNLKILYSICRTHLFSYMHRKRKNGCKNSQPKKKPRIEKK